MSECLREMQEMNENMKCLLLLLESERKEAWLAGIYPKMSPSE